MFPVAPGGLPPCPCAGAVGGVWRRHLFPLISGVRAGGAQRRSRAKEQERHRGSPPAPWLNWGTSFRRNIRSHPLPASTGGGKTNKQKKNSKPTFSVLVKVRSIPPGGRTRGAEPWGGLVCWVAGPRRNVRTKAGRMMSYIKQPHYTMNGLNLPAPGMDVLHTTVAYPCEYLRAFVFKVSWLKCCV